MNARILNLLFFCSLFFGGCFDYAAQNVQRRQTYAESHPNLEQAVRNAIFNRRIITGMTQEQVTASWGRPERVRRNVYSFGVYEQWIYGSWYLNFKNGILTTHKMKIQGKFGIPPISIRGAYESEVSYDVCSNQRRV
jgi:hypothetical protein